MADEDQLYRDLAERETAVVNALSDVEGMEIDAANNDWDGGEIQKAANAAASELNTLLAAIHERMSRIPPAQPAAR